VGRSFAHLHVHTEFSMLDGAARIKEVIAAAVADGQPAIGITDHGNMYGVLDFYKECRNQGITPVIGTEAYMAAESRHERPVRRGRIDDTGGDAGGEGAGEKLSYHLTLLAETTEGYRNLLKLSSAAYLEGYYYKPRLDWELLARHHRGVMATTGCLGGVVLQALLRGDPARARALGASARRARRSRSSARAAPSDATTAGQTPGPASGRTVARRGRAAIASSHREHAGHCCRC